MEEKRRDFTPPPSTETSEHTTTSRRRLKRKSASINSHSNNNNGSNISGSQTTSFKRQAREKLPPIPIHMNGPCTRARVQPREVREASEVKSEAEVREAKAKAEEIVRVNENWEALEAKIEEEYEVVRMRGEGVHVVPVHAGWFSWTKIHQLEEKMLSSFFNGKSESRTPEIYMEIRNWIMRKFHLNPSAQIELKDLSDVTVGELDGRQEVMEFLDYWGLINYNPAPQNESAAVTADSDAKNEEAGKTESLIEKLFQFESVQAWTPPVPMMNMVMPAVTPGLLPEFVVADELVKSEGPSVEYHCNSCSADCSRKRYHCQKQADFDLCADCFNNGLFGSNMSPSDFILMEPAEAGGAGGGNWTDQETLLLLEAIEIFRDNWSEIAEHVATKTKAQCILHFVQMPIEDAFFNRDDENNEGPKENEVPVSTSTENLVPKIDKDGDTTLEDVPASKESQGGKIDNQASSCPVETSKPDEVHESDKKLEVTEKIGLKALKEAFEAVGSLPSPGERFSFAEAGNPVMTLAAFLVRLVEPTIATASVRSILKHLSGNYSGEQLAARHCFCLEDPPDEKKNLADTEGTATETVENEAQKDQDNHVEKKNQESADLVVEGISLQNDTNDENKNSAPSKLDEIHDSSSKPKEPMTSPSSEHADGSDTVKKGDAMTVDEEARPASTSEPSNADSPKEQASKDAEESVVSASPTELQPDSAKESEDGASVGDAKGPLKDEDMLSVPEKKENDPLVMSTPVTEKEENTAGDIEPKDLGNEKKEALLVTQNDLDVEKLKRAAVTALSAAAVKAKLLADQEEDQILKLSTFLIEKQLYKLETKLAFFNDMENVVMRVKEQLAMSKQRLFQERAHIIATRFGARPSSQILPPNRAAGPFPNSGPRPFMGMNSLRPPMSRPMMTPNPTSSTFMPASAAGNSMQPTSDKLSSAGMK